MDDFKECALAKNRNSMDRQWNRETRILISEHFLLFLQGASSFYDSVYNCATIINADTKEQSKKRKVDVII